jgi:hypothetical protein
VARADAQRRAARRPADPIQLAASIVGGYLAAIVLFAASSWVLFIWHRPEDAGSAMLYEVARTGFWQLALWLVLVASALVVLVPIAHLAWSRVIRG